MCTNSSRTKQHPITDKYITNTEVCLEISKKDAFLDLRLLPDVFGFTFTGQKIALYDKVVDIWTSTDYEYGVDGRKMSGLETTWYVSKTEFGFHIPVQLVKKLYNYNTGNLDYYTISNYFDFRDTVSVDEVTIEDVGSCKKLSPRRDFHKHMKFFHPDLPSELDLAFDLYTNHHNKMYQDHEHQMRKKIFEENWRMIEEHNRKNASFRLELNYFSDKSDEELKYLTGTYISTHQYPDMVPFPHTLEEVDDIVQDLPENFDLRMEGVVTPVKSQGKCSSCWAFGIIAAVEGAIARVNGKKLMHLSEQSLVDCAWGYGSTGCNGSSLDSALDYVVAHGIPTKADYGLYSDNNGFCKIKNMTSRYMVRGYTHVPSNSDALKWAVFNHGPVVVNVNATKLMLQYSSGVLIDSTCNEKVSYHTVTIIGYGVSDGEDYWLAKNSWGENWGEGGYILMSKKTNCIDLDEAYYPIV